MVPRVSSRKNVDRLMCLLLLQFTDQEITNKNHSLVQKTIMVTVYQVVRIIIITIHLYIFICRPFSFLHARFMNGLITIVEGCIEFT